jgi:hypothetical protein
MTFRQNSKLTPNLISSHQKNYGHTQNSTHEFNPEEFRDQIKLVDELKSNSVSELYTRKTISERKKGYFISKRGGVECINETELKCQKGIVIDLIKSAGKQLMDGQNFVGVSLPVKIFESRSMLERIIDWWAFGPIYLSKAAEIKNNPLERMKLVVAFAISGLYNGCK